MSSATRVVNAALAEAINRYGAEPDDASCDHGPVWEIDLRGVLRGAVPVSCSPSGSLERLVIWAAFLDLVPAEPDNRTRGTYTCRGVLEHRAVEVWVHIAPPPASSVSGQVNRAGSTDVHPKHRRHFADQPDPSVQGPPTGVDRDEPRCSR